MTTTLLAIALVLGGLAISRLRFVQKLNARAFMPVVYAAAIIYSGVRASHAIMAHARAWPHLLLAGLFFAGVVSSVRASGVLKKL